MPLTVPPSSAQITAALDTSGLNGLAHAVHLALPVTAVVGIDVVVDDRSCSYRNATVEETGDPAAAAAELAARTQLPGDQYLDLAGGPSSLVKAVRSGAYLRLFGAETFGPAPVVIDADSFSPGTTWASSTVRRVCELAWELHAGGMAVDSTLGTLFVDRVNGIVTVAHADAPSRPSVVTSAPDVRAWIDAVVAEIGGSAPRVTGRRGERGAVALTLRCTVDTIDVAVPVQLSRSGTASVGHAPAAIAPLDAGFPSLPDGWEPAGQLEDGAPVVRAPSGITAVLAP